ncbi:MAG: hypothetical protein KBF30_05060 [Hyphomonadaceae bacterium]|nr:hypothetical protein [Hyphomonadaceae bacterium]
MTRIETIGNATLYLGDVSDLAAGAAGEHLVCADLLLQGYRAFLADQNCPYDVAVDVAGRLIRIQVKSTRKAKAVPQRVGHFPAYMWHVRRAGKGGARVYADGDFDLLALVALDCRRVAYLPPSKRCQTVHIRTHDDPGAPAHGGKAGKTFGQFPFADAAQEVLNG